MNLCAFVALPEAEKLKVSFFFLVAQKVLLNLPTWFMTPGAVPIVIK